MDPRDAAGSFLVSRRARLTPSDVGLAPTSGRRRVAGLRRDEVAALAGVSSEYYARLERGAIGRASPGVLDAVAGALRLDDAEREHLHDLAGSRFRPRRPRREHSRPAVSVSLQRALDSLGACPAYVADPLLTIVATNPCARALHAPVHDFADASGAPANLARFAFLSADAPAFYLEWDRVTRACVAALHADLGRTPGQHRLADLVGELSVRSGHFRDLWATHDVHRHRAGVKRIRHPDVGELTLDFDVLNLVADPGLALVVYSAASGTATAQRLVVLADTRP